MKVFLTWLFSVAAISCSCQTLEQELLSVIKLALKSNRLPPNLIHDMDTLRLPTTIPIECTLENGLKQYEMSKMDSIEIHIWDVKHMFMFDMYWLTPSRINYSNNKITFHFRTHTWGLKPINYFKGKLTARKESGVWAITKFRMEPAEYTYNIVKRRSYK